MASPYIRHVQSLAEMDDLLRQNSVVVVSFHAVWSVSCRKIAPFYSRLATTHRSLTNLTFVKVEISEDNIRSVGQKARLIALPTFIMMKNGEEVDRMSGVDRMGLQDMIVKHVPKAAARNLGSADAITAGDESLLEFLRVNRANCLNEAKDHPLKSIVEKKMLNTTEAYLESDVDKQLLITLPFNQEVKIRSVILCTKDSKFGPKKIKIAINIPKLGFDDVESAIDPAVVQILEVPEVVVKEGKRIHLRFVRLKRVNSLHILVESNHGNEDVTRIDAIDVYGPGRGEPPATAQMIGLRDFVRTHEQGMELLELFQRKGGDQNLSNAVALVRESVLLCPAGHGQRVVLVGNLATALLTHYVHRGGYADQREVIVLLYDALELCPPGHPGRTVYLNNLATALQKRFEHEGRLSDLEEAIEKHREVLGLRPPGHPGRSGCLNNLASALHRRFEGEGRLSDLEETIEKNREALGLRLSGHPDRAASLSNLANALKTRYKRDGSPSDLEEAIELQREALGLRPPGHPDRATSLNNLATALQKRFEREGRPSDLEEAIEKHREALGFRPPGHPDHAASLNNLASTLRARYEREGSLSDLEEVIEMQREALSLRPPGHPDRAASLSNLANTLQTRYQRDEKPSDLDKAIEMQREGLRLRPPGNPDRGASLSNLANSLQTRYMREGSPPDLEEAIEMQREALGLHPPGHPNRASCLNNFANTLRRRFEREGRLSSLEEAIEMHREALELSPNGHPYRSASLRVLSSTYLLMINGGDGGSTLHNHRALVDVVCSLLREAVNHSNSSPLDRLKAALVWINASRSLASGSVLDAYGAALDQSDIVLATSSTLARKHSQLSSKELAQCQRLGVEAASCAVRQGDMVRAVEFLERGRNLLFTQIGRYRIDLGELQKENAELAKRFSDLSSRLDSSVVSNRPNLEGRTAFEDPFARYRRVASEWDRVVNDIRAVPGFENFLRPLHYTALQAAATEGPVVIVIPDSDQSHALIILPDRDTPHYVSLPKASREELVTLCLNFFEVIHSDDEDDADSRATALLRRLWVRVVHPIADALENDLRYPLHSRIWWCPSSVLSLLPLHAAGRYGPDTDPNQNFPAKYVSSYAPTLQTLVRARSKRSVSTGESMLIVAQPDTPGQSLLPNTTQEARIVKTLAETAMKITTTLLSSKEGTHAAVLNAMVEHPWIHLTCHGSQNPFNPFDSCFCLYDKKLTLHDIMQRGLPDAKFAFLAACHTATGDLNQLDEGLHLAAGLQFAGFKSVVGTIWEVADMDGPVIAEAFYTAIQEERVGEDGIDCRRAAQALSKAVETLRDNGVPINRWIRHIHIGI